MDGLLADERLEESDMLSLLILVWRTSLWLRLNKACSAAWRASYRGRGFATIADVDLE
jgi:hypothetical protein